MTLPSNIIELTKPNHLVVEFRSCKQSYRIFYVQKRFINPATFSFTNDWKVLQAKDKFWNLQFNQMKTKHSTFYRLANILIPSFPFVKIDNLKFSCFCRDFVVVGMCMFRRLWVLEFKYVHRNTDLLVQVFRPPVQKLFLVHIYQSTSEVHVWLFNSSFYSCVFTMRRKHILVHMVVICY